MNAERCVQPIILLRVGVICNLSYDSCIANFVSICYGEEFGWLAVLCKHAKLSYR